MTAPIMSPEWREETRQKFLRHCLRFASLTSIDNAIEIAEAHEKTDPHTLEGLAAKVREVIAERGAANAG